MVILNPKKINKGYYLESGWASANNVNVPDNNSVWKLTRNRTLTPRTPIELEWDNQNGLVFTKKIEIDDQYLHYLTPKAINPIINNFIDKSIFDDAPKGIRFQKPIQRKKMDRDLVKKKEIVIPKNMKKVSQTSVKINLFDENLVVGNIVEHNRFGAGEVLSLEGSGPNKKAEIKFGTVGKKKLLLQFAKLRVIG